MNISSCHLNFGDRSDEALAKAVFHLFLFQYKQAVSKAIEEEAFLASKRAANKAYIENQEFGGGFTTHLTSHVQFEVYEQKVKRAKEEEDEARQMMLFLRDRFLKGYKLE